jgi:DNA (cytosine-5)-methyltransferase 1
MKVVHYDLFAGIGGFSYAIDQVYGKENTKHIFVEINPFATAVIKKHWPEGEYWGDIREFIADTGRKYAHNPQNEQELESKGSDEQSIKQPRDLGQIDILTAGVPCQPASQAGKRRGKKDDRWLWPETFAVIRELKPDWCILENVRGLLTLERGLVFEELCLELEGYGYSLQPLIIPAVSVNAPHRRDRVWIVAHYQGKGLEREKSARELESNRCSSEYDRVTNASNTQSGQSWKQIEQEGRESFSQRDWERDWQEVAFERCVCELDDGLSRRMVRLPDGTEISYAKWRTEGLKAFGNAIVPQVAIEILKAIKSLDSN